MIAMIQRILIVLLVLGIAQLAAAQTTQPADNDPRLEMRANQAFNRGEYATALPLLNKLVEQLKDQPSRLGSIQERIRVCNKALDSLKKGSPSGDPQQSPLQPLAGADIPTAPETRRKHAIPKLGDVLEMSIKELGNFDYDNDRGGNIPDDVKKLTGSRIRLKGFMIPMDQAENITQFALVPSLFSCCFGQPPQIQHTIVVNCPKGKAVSYCPDEIFVEGDLKVDEKRDDGYVVSIFELTAKSVKPAPGAGK
jgi:hypothetical protein